MSKKAPAKKTEQLREIQDLMAQGRQAFEIQDQMGLTEEKFRSLVSEILGALASHIQEQPIEQVYAQFVLDGHGLIRMLNRTANAEGVSARDAVAAYKASWDIRKDLLDTGKKFGILKPDINELAEGAIGINLTVVQGMDIDELVQSTGDIARKLKKLNSQAGGNVNFLDVPQGDQFSGPTVFELQSSSTKESEEKTDIEGKDK